MAAAPTPKPLSIIPPSAEVNANAVCQFRVDPAATPVQWTIAPAIGTIDQNGVYQSPSAKDLKLPQTVIVTATPTAGGQGATAAISLTNAPRTIEQLGWYAVIAALVIGTFLLGMWGCLHKGLPAPVVVINPPAVTLDPATDDKFSFSATVLGDSKSGVTWSVEPPDAGTVDTTGNFHRKLDTSGAEIDKPIKITAHSVADPSRSDSAIVKLIPKTHLELSPGFVSTFSGQQIEFRAIAKSEAGNSKPDDSNKNSPARPTWSVSRSDIATITQDGVLTAGSPRETSVLVVSAWGPAAHEQASAAVLVEVPFQPTDVLTNWPILLFVITCGALGSMIYYTSSFVAYVGNQTFRSSWFWFYISRPFVGGGLAVIFFFLTEWGKISGATGTDLAAVGAVSALVGLFSDKAVKKLSDILDVLLATKDDRKDKIEDTKPQSNTATAPSPSGPKITSITPQTATANTDTPVQVTGTNFTAALKVQVNSVDILPTDANEQGFKLAIPAAQVKPPKITITVTTSQGSVTGTISVT
jgi:hypothetical protein